MESLKYGKIEFAYYRENIGKHKPFHIIWDLGQDK